MTREQFEQLRSEVESTKDTAARAQGSLDAALERIKKEFGCDSIKTARNLLADLEKKRDRAQLEFDRELKGYLRKWKRNQD